MGVEDDEFEKIAEKAEVFVYRMHEVIEDWSEHLIFLSHGTLEETVKHKDKNNVFFQTIIYAIALFVSETINICFV